LLAIVLGDTSFSDTPEAKGVLKDTYPAAACATKLLARTILRQP
jgi:hypothetical protein